MNYLFSMKRRPIPRHVPRPVPTPRPDPRPSIKKLVYKQKSLTRCEDYESGFSFPIERLKYVNVMVVDDLEF